MFLLVACQHTSSMCQSLFCPVLNLRKVPWKYVELSSNTLSFLTLQFREKDLMPTPNLLRIRPILPPLGHILSVPSRSFGWHWSVGWSYKPTILEVIVYVIDDPTYKLAELSATSGLGQKVCQVVFGPNLHQQGLTHCNRFMDCMVANGIALFFKVVSGLDEFVTWDLLSP